MIAVLRFLFVIPFGFIAANLAAAFALLWPFLDLSGGVLNDPFVVMELTVGLIAQAAQIGSMVLVPWAIFMVLTEILVLPSILLHVGTGLAGAFVLGRTWYGADIPASIQTALFVGGLAFMLVYWIVAGRAAGRWRTRSRNLSPETEGQIP